MRISFLGCKLW